MIGFLSLKTSKLKWIKLVEACGTPTRYDTNRRQNKNNSFARKKEEKKPKMRFKGRKFMQKTPLERAQLLNLTDFHSEILSQFYGRRHTGHVNLCKLPPNTPQKSKVNKHFTRYQSYHISFNPQTSQIQISGSRGQSHPNLMYRTLVGSKVLSTPK